VSSWSLGKNCNEKHGQRNIKKYVLLGYYAASGGKGVFRGQVSKDSRPLKKGSKGCPETSVTDYHYSLRNNPEELSSHLLHGGSLKSRNVLLVIYITILLHNLNC